MNRGVLYITWGNTTADASIESLKRYHPDLPVCVRRLESKHGDHRDMLLKCQMVDLSPFETTLYLDADTVVMGDLTFGFASAEHHGLACCICECPWLARYPVGLGDQVEYNCGVLFWSRRGLPVMREYRDIGDKIDSSISWLQNGKPMRMDCNDQAAFGIAVNDWGSPPFVLPLNWNFRPQWHRSWFGPLKVWHDRRPVPDWLIKQNATAGPMTFSELCVEHS